MSLTISGLIVMVLAMISRGAGVDIGTEELTDFVNTGGQLIAVIMIYWGRMRRGDLTFWGGRKAAQA